MARLRRGDLPPRIIHPVPGPAGRLAARQLRSYEAPGINTLKSDGSTLVWQEARGSNVVDVDGNRYIDLTAGFGVAAVGHRHPEVVRAIRHQSGILVHGLGDVHAHPLRAEVAKHLIRLAPVNEPQVFFAVSGSDAVEIALKTALLATGRSDVLAFDPAYHGLSLGALQLTSRQYFRSPFEDHFHHHIHRLPFGCPPDEVATFFDRHRNTACLVVEPIVGREGILLPPEGWLENLRLLSRQHDVLFVADEVFTGLGRTGRWFAVDADGVEPDLLCCGKALGGGLPIAAVIGERDLMTAWSQDGEALHSGTFVANPLACAAALAVLRVLTIDRLALRAARLGKIVARQTRGWSSRFEDVLAVRGKGLLWGVELQDSVAAHRVTASLEKRGLLVLAGGPGGRVLQLSPPLVISETQLCLALEMIERALAGN